MSKNLSVINFFNENVHFLLRNKSYLKIWVSDTIITKKKTVGPINFVFCTDKYLLALNKTYLRHNNLTDIISFDYTIKKQVSGDIFISIERVTHNAKLLNISFKDEIHRVMIHGVLHLCGYSDKSLKEKASMRKQEDKYLSLRTF
jgi:rRNA maturation RNase YbeY